MPGTGPRALLLRVPPVVELLQNTERWQASLADSNVQNRATLARRKRTSTGRVYQVLRLLELPPGLLGGLQNGSYVVRIPMRFSGSFGV